MRVGILYDDVDSRPNSTRDERGVLEAVDAADEALAAMGHDTVRVPAGSDPSEWSRKLEWAQADVILNLCEGLGGRSDGEVLAAETIEAFGIPFTGSSSNTLAVARRKDRVNSLLRDLGFPIPPWTVWQDDGRESESTCESGSDAAAGWSLFPAIVKPVAEDSSVGIDQNAVVGNSFELGRRMDAVRHFGRLMIQAFIGDREINVGIIGDEVLPLAEILFDDLPAGFHPIVGFDAKWLPGSAEDLGTRPVCPAPLNPSMARRARELAANAWRAVGGRGYGRVDLRLTEPDKFHILEVNPNPDLAPSAGLARMAATRGWSYGEMLQRIIDEACTGALRPAELGKALR